MEAAWRAPASQWLSAKGWAEADYELALSAAQTSQSATTVDVICTSAEGGPSRMLEVEADGTVAEFAARDQAVRARMPEGAPPELCWQDPSGQDSYTAASPPAIQPAIQPCSPGPPSPVPPPPQKPKLAPAEAGPSAAAMREYRERKVELLAALRQRGGRELAPRGSSGFAGLTNQGATCYLNSLLQALFMTPEFRQQLLGWSYDAAVDGASESCIPLQLQLLFARLQLGSRGVLSTQPLTQSFGWTAAESFAQHDVQELCRVLFDALERCGGGRLAPTIALWRGALVDFVECTRCGFRRERQDAFMDLGLDVTEGGTAVEDALRAYTAPETLDGDNCWHCDKCDEKVKALKGLRLGRLPPLLVLQLKRFQFDYALNRRVKLDHRLSFEESLSVAGLVDEGGDSTEYELQSVLVHAGTAMGGHYHAFVRDCGSGKWYDFNDANVSEIDIDTVKRSYGGGADEAGGITARSGSGTTAYMLLYRRADLLLEPADWMAHGSEARKAQILGEDAGHSELLRLFEIHKQCINVQVFVLTAGSQSSAHASVSLDIHGSASLQAATDEADELLESLGGGAEWSGPGGFKARLRLFDVASFVAGKTFGGREQEALRSLALGSSPTLLLERVATSAAWSEFDPDDLIVRIATWDAQRDEVGAESETASVPVAGKAMATVGDLRKAIEAVCHVPRSEQIVLLLGRKDGVALVDDAKQLQRDYRIGSGDKLVLERCAASADHTAAAVGSQALRAHLEAMNAVTLLYKKPKDPGAEERSITADRRQRLSELKSAVASDLEMDERTFHFRRQLKGPQLKEESKTIGELGLTDNAFLHIVMGRVLQPDEVILKCSAYNPAASPRFQKMFSVAVDCRTTRIDELKRLVTARLLESGDGSGSDGGGSNDEGSPVALAAQKLRVRALMSSVEPAELLRLRDKANGEAGKLLLSQMTLRQAFARLADEKEIAVQFLEKPETIGAKDVVLQLMHWRVSEKAFGLDEIVASREWTAAELKRTLAEWFVPRLEAAPAPMAAEGGEEGGARGWAVAKGVGKVDHSGAKRLKWSDEKGREIWAREHDETLISQPPLSLRNTAVLVLRSDDEIVTAKKLAAAQRAACPESASGDKKRKSKGRPSGGAGGAGGGKVEVVVSQRQRSERPREKGLSIKVADV